MGCDIHGVVERRISQKPLPDKWIAVRTLNWHNATRQDEHDSRFSVPLALSRNYERFAALAGVRGDGPNARGLPADVSDTAAYLYATEGDHTPSWLPLTEAADIFQKTERNTLRDYDTNRPSYTYFGIDIEAGDLAEDFRLVFWFDS